MQTQTPTHPAGIVLRAFVAWYTLKLSRRIVGSGRDGLTVVARAVPFLFLLRTLITPWKQIRNTAQRKGFNVEAWAGAVSLNATARVIGMVLRTALICLGIFLAAIVIVCLAAAMLIWTALPFAIAILLVLIAIFV